MGALPADDKFDDTDILGLSIADVRRPQNGQNIVECSMTFSVKKSTPTCVKKLNKTSSYFFKTS